MKPRILIVDDEESILSAVRDYFETQARFDVDCARELEEAEALLSHVHYDLLIADLRLTGAHSSEGLELIRFARERSPWTRVVLLTSYGSPELESEAMSRGVDAFLQKPMPLSDLARLATDLTRATA